MAVLAFVEDVDAHVDLTLDHVVDGAIQNLVELLIGDGSCGALQVRF